METNDSGKSRTCYNPKVRNALGRFLKNLVSNLDSNAGYMNQFFNPQFQCATLSEASGTWRIVWYNYSTEAQALCRVRKTFDLNRIHDITERRRVARQYVSLINDALKLGYNYFTHTLGEAPAPGISDLPQIKAAVLAADEVTIAQALQKALKIRQLGKKPRTASSYKSMTTRLTEWLTVNELAARPVSAFTATMFQDYLFYKGSEGHGNGNLNEHLNYFKTTFDVLRANLKLIAANPLVDIEYLPEVESRKFQPLTPEEIAIIVPALIAYNPRFYLYTKFIAHEYIRPHHIARLLARDINYSANTISLGGETTKNNKIAEKQLLSSVKGLLLELEYHKLPGKHYLFGKNFAPSAQLYPRLSITAAEVWKEIVIDGLGIHKQMYALKHTSVQYFVNENKNFDIYYLRQQLEHSSAQQTEIYLQRNVRKKITEKDVKGLVY